MTPKKESVNISLSLHSPPDEFNFSARGPTSARKVKRINPNEDHGIGLSPPSRRSLLDPPIEFRSIPPPPLPQPANSPLRPNIHDSQLTPIVSPVQKDSSQHFSPSFESPSELLDLEKYLENQTPSPQSPHFSQTIGFIDLTSDSFSHLLHEVNSDERSTVPNEPEFIEPATENHTQTTTACSGIAEVNSSDDNHVEPLNLVDLPPLISAGEDTNSPPADRNLPETFSDSPAEALLSSSSESKLVPSEVKIDEKETPEILDSLVKPPNREEVHDTSIPPGVIPCEENAECCDVAEKIAIEPAPEKLKISTPETTQELVIETHVSFSSCDSGPASSKQIVTVAESPAEALDEKAPHEEAPRVSQEVNPNIGLTSKSEDDQSPRVIEDQNCVRSIPREVPLDESCDEMKGNENSNLGESPQLSEHEEILVTIENPTPTLSSSSRGPSPSRSPHDPPFGIDNHPTSPLSHSRAVGTETTREIDDLLEFLDTTPTVKASDTRRGTHGGYQENQYFLKENPILLERPYDRYESKMDTLLDHNDDDEEEANDDNFVVPEADVHDNSEEEIELDIQYDSPQSSVTQSDFDTISEFDLHNQASFSSLRRVPLLPPPPGDSENPSAGMETTNINEQISSSSMRRNLTLSSFISEEEQGGRDGDEEQKNGIEENENVERAWRVYETEEGYHYHYNHITDESTWHCPLGLYLDRHTRPASAFATAAGEDEEEFRECECMQITDHENEEIGISDEQQSDQTRDWNQPPPESENQILLRQGSSSTLSSIDPTSEIRTISQRISPANQSQRASNPPVSSMTSPDREVSFPTQTPFYPDPLPHNDHLDPVPAPAPTPAVAQKKPSRWKQITKAIFRR